MKNDPRRLILASSSIYRRDLLRRIVPVFEYSSPNIDESKKDGETAQQLVIRLATEKATILADRYPDCLIIGSDQVAVNGLDILGKPCNRASAIEQLTQCSGRTVEFFTALALFDTKTSTLKTELDRVTVTFRKLTDLEIERYIDKEQPFDCAGSFKCEGLGITLFESILSNDPNTLIGLPMIKLNNMLIQAGYNPLLIDH